MNERHEHFLIEMESDLLSETHPSLAFPRLEVSLILTWSCESSLTLESNIADNAPFTELEEVFDLSLTSLSIVAPSFFSTPVDTSVSELTLLDSPHPLA